MRQGCVPKDSGPQFAPHLINCAVFPPMGEMPAATIATKTSTLMPTRTVVTEKGIPRATCRGRAGAGISVCGLSTVPEIAERSVAQFAHNPFALQ